MKLKIILFFLAALLAIIIFKMVFVGVVIFVHLVKYIVIAAAIAYGAYWLSKKLKKDE
jgi:antibiotic biosynthesis monooxygenase (ABM) superfamily enzyme